jgi:glycosyltransferase involved in cell wall biosynthesis
VNSANGVEGRSVASIAAHLIVGARPEPFLSAMLESIEGLAQTLIVNDNSPDTSPHAAILASSRFGRENRLIVDRTPFTGFADARNVCLRLHGERSGAQWVAFIDADEVHAAGVRRIAARLDSVPRAYDFVDGYTWHFFASFEYYTSIERRMMFFRYAPEARWEGAVHERLLGLDGRRIALPYVYAHYGHTLDPRRHAEKGRHYSSLGAPGDVLEEDQLGDFDVSRYFSPVYPRLLRFRGRHPTAVVATLSRLNEGLLGHHALTKKIVRRQPPKVKARNVLRKLNYELRWRGRVADPLARWLAR